MTTAQNTAVAAGAKPSEEVPISGSDGKQLVDEKLADASAANTAPPAASQQPPKPPAQPTRRMRSSSNIALVETPQVLAAGSKSERPIQRAIRETVADEPVVQVAVSRVVVPEKIPEVPEDAPEKDVVPDDKAEAKHANTDVTMEAEEAGSKITESKITEPKSGASADDTDGKTSQIVSLTPEAPDFVLDTASTDAAEKDAVEGEGKGPEAPQTSDVHIVAAETDEKAENKADGVVEMEAKEPPAEKKIRKSDSKVLLADADTASNNVPSQADSMDVDSEAHKSPVGIKQEDNAKAKAESTIEGGSNKAVSVVEKSPSDAQPSSAASVAAESAVAYNQQGTVKKVQPVEDSTIEVSSGSSEKAKSLEADQEPLAEPKVAAEPEAVDSDVPIPNDLEGAQDKTDAERAPSGDVPDDSTSGKATGDGGEYNSQQSKEAAAGEGERSNDEGDDKNAAEEPAEEPAEDAVVEKPRVQIYGSTVSGNRTYKKQAKDLFAMLEANEIDFEFICLAVDEQAKKYVRRKALGNMTIPQVYVDGEFKGFFEDAFKANENDELYEWLGLDEDPIDF